MELPAEDLDVYNWWTGQYGFNQYVDSRTDFSATGETAYLVTAIATGGTVIDRAFLNAIDTDPLLGTPSTLLRSADIRLTGRSRPKGVTITMKTKTQSRARRFPSSGRVRTSPRSCRQRPPASKASRRSK